MISSWLAYLLFWGVFLGALVWLMRKKFGRSSPDEPLDGVEPPKEPAMTKGPPFFMDVSDDEVDADADEERRERRHRLRPQ